MNTTITSVIQSHRRGSTLVIVIALLGLLAFTGMVFLSFATSERSAAEYFSEAAKGEIDEPDNVWDYPLRHIISGPSNRPDERMSILRSKDRRLSLVANLVGSDLSPHSGQGLNLIMEDDPATAAVVAVPRVDLDQDGTANDEDVDGPQPNTQGMLDFVDSPAFRFDTTTGEMVEDRPVRPPAPDVDYTYPDINNLFLAYKGWAIRDNGAMATPRYERVPVIIPSFFRPQYMKTAAFNGLGGNTAPTDIDWASSFDGINRAPVTSGGTTKFGGRSFRPHPSHVVVSPQTGAWNYRYLTTAEAAGLGISSGGFPFVPDDNLVTQPGGTNGVFGDLGVWTGSDPEDYELDSDNDGGAGANPSLGGDGTREGIWIDTHFPVQESTTGQLYTVLHSFTIYDLDGLINVNVHGNLAGLDRAGDLKVITSNGTMNEQFLSKSNLGLGPNEINPLYAMRANVANLKNLGLPAFDAVRDQFSHHYGVNPGPPASPFNNVSQANMEWIWLTTGRAQIAGGVIDDLYPGRWGENERLFNAVKPGGTFDVADLPRPGRQGDAQSTGSSGTGFGGGQTGNRRNGFDDNQDRMDGEINPGLGRVRAYGTPMDYAGTGRTHTGTVDVYNGSGFPLLGDIRLPLTHHDTSTYGPERFLGFNGYSLMRDVDTSVPRYFMGQDNTFTNGTGDDLIANVFYDPLFEDPLESVFDPELSDRDFDRVFGPQDLLALHLTSADLGSSPDDISERLLDLSPYALDDANGPFTANEQVTPGVRGRFTTLSNSLHRFMMRSPFGADGKPGVAGVDENGDGIVDNAADLTAAGSSFVYGTGDVDNVNRAWEFSADTDGADTTGDGYPDGDGLYEFPPSFGTTVAAGKPYSATDPFRPQVRRLLTLESGDGRSLIGQMPISPNHILDVERNQQTPDEGTPRFLYYMQRAGMRFRPLIDHPLASEANTTATVPSSTLPVPFPPQNVGDREYWARRDRQKLARDIFVLLYTTGGAGIDTSVTPNRTHDYTTDNTPGDPANAEGTAGTLYTHEQLRRMAQFAVNMVDAMDSDNVMTKFEYDKNLGDGWNLNDDPFSNAGEGAASTNAGVTGGGLYPEDGAARGVVWGIEAQELAISETHGIHSNNPSMDHASTPYADDTTARDFLYVELQSLRPTPLTLSDTNSTTADTAIWRMTRHDRDSAAGGHNAAVGAPGDENESFAILQHAQNVVDGGGRFSISVASDSNMASSAFYVDHGDPAAGSFDGTYELVAPDASGVTLPTTQNQDGSMDPGYVPLTDIDLIHNDHDGTNGAARAVMSGVNFLQNLVDYDGNTPLETANGRAGTFRGANTIPSQPVGLGFDLVLERRANPNMPSLAVADNPWVQVDRIRVTFDNFAIQDGDVPTAIYDDVTDPMNPSGYLTTIRSTERVEPLDDTNRPDGNSRAKTAVPYRFNTVKGAASAIKSDLLGVNAASLQDPLLAVSMANPANPFELWQPHFDREYGSTGELLSLPLVGPNLLTQRLNRMRYPGYQQAFDNPFSPPATPPATLTTNLLSSAEAMFLSPDFTNLGTATDSARDNRWYRLFQFVEVPSRVHRMLGNYLTLNKIPGKINVNMIRHREVLAGLVDNPYLADVPALDDETVGAPPNTTNNQEDGPFMTSASDLGGRDLYRDFLRERDGTSVMSWDPVAGSSKPFWIPGTPNSRPFRSLGALGSTAAVENGLDRSVLRRLAADRDDDGDGADEVVDVGITEPESNRHWLELSTKAFHRRPGDTNASNSEDVSDNNSNTAMQRHAILSKVMNNTTTVSNCFIVHGTAAYFEVYEDPTTGLHRVGGRFDLDGDGDETNDQQRATFVIDRTDAYEAYDPGTGDFDWSRLVKARATIE